MRQRIHDLMDALKSEFPGDEFVVRDVDGLEYEITGIEGDDDNPDRVVISIETI